MKRKTAEVTKVSAMTRLLLLLLAGVIWLALSPGVYAAEETLTFSTPEKKQLYRKLTEEMRCLKCQNQNLAGSPAGLAEDLKREIFLMVEEGQSAAQITQFMVARYGDFILYKPAIKPLTLVLWIAPFVLMLIGLYSILKLSKSRSSGEPQTGSELSDDPASIERARQLLQTSDLSGEPSVVTSTDHSSAR